MNKRTKKKKKTIGEMTNSRGTWLFNPSTRVVANKKGKGAYSRKKDKQSNYKEAS